MIPSSGALVPNNTSQVTFDLLPIFAAAKTGIASSAPELRRQAASSIVSRGGGEAA